MKTSNLITALALGVIAYGMPVTETPDSWSPAPADPIILGGLASIAMTNAEPLAGDVDVNIKERGNAPVTIAGAIFHPAWLPRVRPAAQAITVAGHAVLMTAWVDAQNRICIILDAAFPGIHGTITAGVQNLHNHLGVLPHIFELGKTYVASDNGGEIEPADTWQWFWFK
ncbi:hypothetical protein BDP81DRAFT_397147 [Colletotrichum phormii]|uniref:Uncharacterized protein n=1 Tax=Colletotrichum phormii TaxID=359342 RepID=A0AAI9ZM78_9PEZI|nr:uncharacterized protein BDP81DRAFT_397147 [Colletotrichum phormii]KAK1633242.1 hypothetical protein BDP81DRAFT_397147 [Colletotrichum phormii]